MSGAIMNIMDSVTRFRNDSHHKTKKLPAHADAQEMADTERYHAESLDLPNLDVVVKLNPDEFLLSNPKPRCSWATLFCVSET